MWFFLALAVPVGFGVATVGAVDLAYHVRLGHAMLHTHQVIRADTLTFTVPGRAWLDQQWLAQILFAVFSRAGGWGTVAAVHGLLIAAIAALVFLSCRRAGASARAAALLTLGGVGVALPNLGMRPQIFGALLFAVVVWLVWERRRRSWLLLLVPVAMALWANLHGSFPLGLAVLVVAAVEDLFLGHPRDAVRLLGVAALGAAATLLNPFGPRVWAYVVDLSGNPEIRRSIAEWKPPTFRHLADYGFFVSVPVVAAILLRRWRWFAPVRLVWLVAFLALAVLATRNALWWGLIAAPVVATAMPVDRLAWAPVRWRSAAGALVGAAFLLAPFPWSLVGAPATDPGSRMLDAPGAVTAALAKELRPGERVLAAQALGSWAEFALPGHPVAVDSRIELYPQSVWDRYQAVSAAWYGWQQTLTDWHVRAVLARTDQQAGLVRALLRSAGWRVVARDGPTYALVRRVP